MKQLNLGAPTIYTGSGSLAALRNIPATRVFVVTGGSSMFKNGAIDAVQTLFSKKGCAVYVHSGIRKNPDTHAVIAGLDKMRSFAPDVVVAIGGGSPLDAAKVMMLLYEHPHLALDTLPRTPLPQARGKVTFVAVPSTSGTGSEVSRSAVVTYAEQQLKVAFRTPYFIPDVAILDPDLTMSMPADLVAETGMDAMTHAIESYLNPNADEFTRTLSIGAIGGLFDYLPVSYRDSTPESRAKVHAYQSMAGIAFANSGLGMVHGIAHALGGQYDMGHGLLNAIVLPYALQFDVAHDPGVQVQLDGLARQVGKHDLIQALFDLNQALQIPGSLREAGVAAEQFERDLDHLTVNALKGPTASNPVPITPSQMTGLLRRVFAGK